jgi:hypothetical protein
MQIRVIYPEIRLPRLLSTWLVKPAGAIESPWRNLAGHDDVKLDRVPLEDVIWMKMV